MTQRTRPPARSGGRPGAPGKGSTAPSRAGAARNGAGRAGTGARRPAATVSAGSADRFAARRRARRWEGLRPLVTLVVLAVLAGTCLWVTYWSPWLTVRKIEVSGLQTLSREQVLAAAAIELDRPLARLDPSAVRSRVEALPRVRLAQVHRHWPRAVALTVVERQAAAVVRVGRSYRLVDPDGVAFATVATRPAAVPVVVTARQAQPSAAALRAAIEVLGALPPAVSERVTSVSAGTPDAITLGLAGGVTVMWGSAEASARKAEVLGALMRLKAKVYDVSAPDAPTTR